MEKVLELCGNLSSKNLKESKLLEKLEIKISALKCNAINIEVAEAEEKKEAKEKQMLLKILTSNGIEEKEAENFAKYYV